MLLCFVVLVLTFSLSLFITISQTPLQMCQSLKHSKLWYSLFLLYRVLFSCGLCVFIYLSPSSAIDGLIVTVFAIMFLFVYLSIMGLYHFKIINPLQGSIDRTVEEMIKNDMVKDVKELEMFGSRLNEKKVRIFRHSNNESLWMRAFKSANVKNMKYLLSIDPNIDINEQDKQNGRTPIIYASIYNNMKTLTFLLSQQQINVNQCDNNGWTALLYAVHNGSFDLTKLLLEAGADVNVTTSETGQTPIILSAVSKSVNIAELIISQSQIIDINHRTMMVYCLVILCTKWQF